MLHRILAVVVFAGTTATLAAQSSTSFELNTDSYWMGGGGYTDLVAGDFNNDGKPDIIECCGLQAGNSSPNQLEFRKGNGDGTFEAPVAAVDTPTVLLSLAAADLNGDGTLDLVGVSISSSGPATVLDVWFGNGDGTFGSPQTYTLTDPGNSMVTGNFFDDGHVDVAIGESGGNVDIFRNEGNGILVLQKSISLSSTPYAEIQIAGGDLNGNGVTNLAATEFNGGGAVPAWVVWNDGKGDFTPTELGSYVDPVVSVARLNGDGMMDILVSYTCDPTPTNNPGRGPEYNPCAGFDAYYGQGNNSLYKRTLIADSGVYGGSAALGVDVNGDGYGDIVSAAGPSCDCNSGLYVWLGNADGSFQQTPQVFLDGGGPLIAADFNRDGMIDFAGMSGSDGVADFFINATSRAACGTYTISPTVTACQPVDDTYAPSPVTVQANGYDTTPITAMQEYIDGTLEYSKPVTSFDTTFPLTDGSHLLVTKGWDASGRSFVADRTVTVYTGTPGPVCPAATDSANICLPAEATSSSPGLILANGDTGTGAPSAAQLYIDGTLVVNNQGYCQNGSCVGGTSYVQTTQSLSPGTHDLVFKLWSFDGDVYQAQKTITVN